MARVVFVVGLLLLCGLARADWGGHDHDDYHHHGNPHGNHHHGPQSCRNGEVWCRGSCQKYCSGQEQGINIETCKRYGSNKGSYAAKQACDTSTLYCKGGQRSRSGPPQRTKVSLAQCGNAAYGVCQSTAMERRSSPCGYAFNGMQQCTKDEFMKFYTAEVDWWCNTAVAEFDKKP